MISIQDNFLSEQEHQALYNVVTDEFFPWCFTSYIIGSKLEKAERLEEEENNLEAFQLVHVFYNDSQIVSKAFSILNPLVKKLNHQTLVRIKLNLNPYSQKLMIGGYHRDQNFKCKAAIYYLNTNNGYTLFKKGKKKVNSVKNRIVFFDTEAYHLGTNSTDCKNRLVLNFNYF